MKAPRIALCGISLESNAFSPVTTEEDFRGLCYVEGDDVVAESRAEVSVVSREMVGFVQAMDCMGDWTPVPLVLTASHPWGPVDQAFLERVVDDIIKRLQAAGPVDGVYVANHGAMVATGTTDPDGYIYQRLRDEVGPDVPIIGTLDLHANCSDRMVEATTLLVGYLTNPHVDMLERGEESALSMRTILNGKATPHTAFIRMPIVAASVSLLTHQGPYADLIDYGQRRKREMAGAILNVTILGGFAFSDTPENGLAIVVTGRHELESARALAVEIARRAWDDRERFRKTLTTLESAVATALSGSGRPLIYSDAGDNPGGGGGGDTTELLSALIAAGARNVLYGSFYDAELAAQAEQAGVGATIKARFNRTQATSFSTPLEVEARVVAVSTEPFVGRRGIYAGRLVLSHPSVALEIGGEGGITVVVISNRYQCADPMFFEHLGLDVGAAKTVCVKSRGHFRAGFDLWFEPERVVEVDTVGLTSPVLERLPWKGLPRPVFPLDADAVWSPPNW
jgi:microcystin degradation protein MlrC